MAFTAREVIMVFRGQNYLSGALRRVGRDVGALSQVQLTQQRQQLQVRRSQIESALRLANAEKASVTQGGQRYLAVQAAKNNAIRQTHKLQTQVRDREREVESAHTRSLRAVQRRADIERAIAAEPAALQVAQGRKAQQIEQLTTGSKALAIQRQQLMAEQASNAELTKTQALSKRIMVIDEQQLRIQGQLAKLARIKPSSVKFAGVPQARAALVAQQERIATEREMLLGQQATIPAVTTARQDIALAELNAKEYENMQTVRRLSEEYNRLGLTSAASLKKLQVNFNLAIRSAKELAEMEAIAQRRVEEANMALQEQGLKLEQITAREAALAEREQQLTAIIAARNDALALQNEKLAANARTMNALPWQKFTSGAAKVEHAGRVIQMLGLIGTASMGYLASSAAQFGTSMTLAATQSTTATNNSTKNIVRNSKILQGAVTDLLASGRTAAQPSDLTDALYQIFSGLTFSGGQASQLRQGLSILEQFNAVYTANYGQVEFNDIVSAGINLINNFGLRASQLPKVMNTMQASVRFGAMGMGQFVGSLSQVVPAYRAAHYSFRQMAQDVAFVSRLFPQSLRTGTTGLARLTEMFSRPNVIQGIQQQFGVNIAPRGQLLPIHEILDEIQKARPGVFATSTAIGNFFKQVGGTQGTIQARRVLAGYVGEMKLYRTVARQVAGDNNELSRSIKAMRETPGFKWDALKNQLRAVALELGAGAIPAFKGAAAPLIALVRAFDNLSPRTQRLVGEITTIVAIGTLVVGTLAAVGGAIAKVVGMARLAIGFSEGEGILAMILRGRGAFSSEAGFATVRFGLIGAAITALILLMMHWHQVMRFINNDLGGMGNALRILALVLAGLQFTAAIRGTTLLGSQLRSATIDATLLRTRLLGLSGMVVSAAVLLSFIPKPHGVQTDPNAPSQLRGQQFFEGLPLVGHAAQWVGRFADIISGHSGGIKNAAQAHREAIREARNVFKEERRLALSTVNYQQYRRQAKVLFPPDMIMNLKTYNKFVNDITRNVSRGAWTPKSLRKDLQDATRAAHQYGTTASGAFQRAFLAYRQAEQAAKADPKNFQKQMQAQDALAALQNVATKQQFAAAKASANAVNQNVTPAWQAATQQGIIASATYTRLYRAVNRAQAIMQRDPTVANQRAYLQAQRALDNYVQNATQSTQQLAQTTKVSMQDVVSSITQMYEQLLQQNQTNFGELFQGPFIQSPRMQNFLQWGGKLTGPMLTKDLQSQIRQFRNFNNLLGNLARRGAPAELINQLRAMGPAAIQQIRALTKMSGPELRNYFNLFKKAQQEIHQQTMRDLNRQLKDYLKYGRNIGKQMAAGLRQESPAITKAIEAMVRRAFGGRGLRGGHGGGGGSGGGEHHTHHHVHHHDHTQYNIYGDRNSKADTQARHERFRHRHRHRHRQIEPGRYGR